MPLNLGTLTDAENRFRQGYVQFARQWSAVSEQWLDDRRRKFEQQHLLSIGPSLSRLSASLRLFEETVRKADRELADTERADDALN